MGANPSDFTPGPHPRRHALDIQASSRCHGSPGAWESIAGTTDGSGIASNLTGAAPKGVALSLAGIRTARHVRTGSVDITDRHVSKG
jgi:hypothetical protein